MRRSSQLRNPLLPAACLISFAAAACAPAPAAPAAPALPTGAAPLVLGETFQLDSTILGQRRVVNVFLPPGYREGSVR